VIRLVDCVAIVMEYAAHGELFDYVQKRQRIPEFEVKTFMFQILLAVNKMHSMGIVHRDLKLENILLTSENQVKIADFGFSNYWNDSGLKDRCDLLKTSCGSPCYAAPEIVLNNKVYICVKGEIIKGFYNRF
jgi:protein-serine/threonine kinase